MSDEWVTPLCYGLIIILAICLIVIIVFEIKVELLKRQDYNFLCYKIEKETDKYKRGDTMRCPKCNREMCIDDRDSDYMAYNNLPVLTNRTTWWLCDHCGYNAIQETKVEYYDVNSKKLELDEYIESDEDYE